MSLAEGTQLGKYEVTGQLGAVGTEIYIVQNWFDDLNRLAPRQ